MSLQRRRLALGSCLVALLAMSSCGYIGKKNVSVFERQYLSQNGMELTLAGKEGPSIQHMLNAREGSTGGFGGAGGGCGCN